MSARVVFPRLALGIALLAPPVAAQDAKVQAEALFKEAVALSAKGDHAAACQKLEASDKLETGLGTKLRLADCREKTGRLATAWAAFREGAALAALRKDKREKIARDRAGALEQRLSTLTVEVQDPAAGLEVKLAGVVLARAAWGTRVPFDGGTYDVEARAGPAVVQDLGRDPVRA